jgi:hypothetical protein
MLRNAGQNSPVQSRWPEIGNAFKLFTGILCNVLLTGTSILAVSASTELYWQVATLPSSPNLENHHQGEGTRETNF